MTKEFYVDTPIGKIRVYAKHDGIAPDDYPGIYVEWVTKNYSELIACVEYDSSNEVMQTFTYKPFNEEPVRKTVHGSCLSWAERYPVGTRVVINNYPRKDLVGIVKESKHDGKDDSFVITLDNGREYVCNAYDFYEA